MTAKILRLYGFLCSISFLFFLNTSIAQEIPDEKRQSIDVYLDCSGCDYNYIRQEIFYVNYVRDQELAQVHIFVTRMNSGNGGRVYELSFIGREEFEGKDNELSLKTSRNDTPAEIRKELTQMIALGIIPYLSNSKMASQITINVERDAYSKSDLVKEDPWDYWVFKVFGEADIEKESQRSEFEYEYGLNISRVTEDLRIHTNFYSRSQKEEFDNNGTQITSNKDRRLLRGKVVKSLSNHWSYGGFYRIESNSFTNLNVRYLVGPALEYNIFPYSEVSRKELTLAYHFNYLHQNYIEETIYDKMSENLLDHSLNMAMRLRQPWGNVFTRLEASQYLHDLSQNRLEVNSYVNIRLLKGLSFRVSFNYDLIQNQVSLPKGDTSLEEVLLRQKQLATDFELYAGVGLSYSFGSNFNNIVNTRL